MGTTVGSILISYDVSSKNPEIKEALKKLGYMEEWRSPVLNKNFKLPNTTLWHNNKSSNQGLTDMQSVCKEFSVILEKAISVKATEFVGI